MSDITTAVDLRGRSDDLASDKGRTVIADAVVAKIAGVAAREIAGVYDMGTGASRAFGMLKERLPVGGAPNPTQGVKVEVGERQAAIDIDLIVEYGVAIPDLAEAVRGNVVEQVQRMTGLEVTEVNIAVDDVHLDNDDITDTEHAKDRSEPRVQ